MQVNRPMGVLLAGVGALVVAAGTAAANGRGYPAAGPAVSENGSRFSECYVRADVGYGWSASDKANATITPPGFGSASGRVESSSFDDSWFGEVGFGCSFVRQSMMGGSIKDQPVIVTTPSGLRGDITFGFHGDREFEGVPVNPPAPPLVPPAPPDPVHAKVQTNTLMFNLYYDLLSMGAITPYVGAGIGMAFVELHSVTFTNGTVVRLPNTDDVNLAWSLMAGLSTDIGRGMKLDIGYRYLNMGDIATNNGAGFRLKIDDLSEHQVKIGVRIPIGAFGG